MNTTKIQWTDHTFNPWWGCARVSPACRHCYADSIANRWGHELWRRKGPRRMMSDAYWRGPARWNRAAQDAGAPAKVFCASMADVFEQHPVPEINAQLDAARSRLWTLIEQTPWLIWQLLTKRPENVADLAPWGDTWPDSVWLGASVEDQRRVERIPILEESGARTLFLSCEPLLESLDLTRHLGYERPECDRRRPWTDGQSVAAGDPVDEYWCQACGAERPLAECGAPRISWVITGGESGAKARPTHPAWFRKLRDQCQRAGVPFFYKQTGEYTSVARDGDPWLWREPAFWMNEDGRCVDEATAVADGGSWVAMHRGGTKHTGRELDGRTWDEFPKAAS